MKEFVADQVQESEQGTDMDSIANGAFVKIVGKNQDCVIVKDWEQSQQVGDPGIEFTSNYKHKREVGKEFH